MNTESYPELKQLAEELRKQKRDKIDFVIKGTQAVGRGRPRRSRTIRVTLSGEEVERWLDDPTYDAIWDVYGWHFIIDDDDEYDGEDKYSLYNVTISAS